MTDRTAPWCRSVTRPCRRRPMRINIMPSERASAPCPRPKPWPSSKPCPSRDGIAEADASALPWSSRTLSYEQPPSPTAPRRGCRKVTEAPTTTALLQAARRRQQQRRRCKAAGETWSREQDGATTRTPEGYGAVNNNNSDDKHGCTAFFVAAV
jgi:hypothetical protein